MEKECLSNQSYHYKKAGIADLEQLVATRIQVLRAANKLDMETDMETVRNNSLLYYQEAFQNNTHTAYLVYHEDEFIGAGGVSYYQVMPTYHNKTGWKAYIMNMYTVKSYRRQGIAKKVLNLLIAESIKRGITDISLEATESGRKLYENCGFIPIPEEMKYHNG